MRLITLFLLYLLGLAEIMFGVLVGPLQTYASKANYSRAMNSTGLSLAQQEALARYLSPFGRHYHTVAWFGVITLGLAVLVTLFTQRLPVAETAKE